MKRFFVVATVLLLLFFSPVLSASAEEKAADTLYQEQLEASGADALWDRLPEETRTFLKSIGIDDLAPENYTALQPKALLDTLVDQLSRQAGGVATTCGMLLGIIVLGALTGSLRHALNENGMADIFSIICAAVACGAILLPIATCVRQVCEAADGVMVFMLSFAPAYAAVIVAGGQGALAASYSTVLLTGAECVSALVTGVVLPLLTVSLGISAVASLSEKTRIGTLGGLLSKAAGWLLATVTGLFTALVSLQSPVAASADTLGLRTAKMSIAGFVPIVGGALAETFGTLTSCVRLLRSTLGMFGILAAGALVLPSFFRCMAWSVSLGICRMAAESLEVKPVTALLSAAQGVVKTLMGVLAASALFMIVTTTVVTKAGGGL